MQFKANTPLVVVSVLLGCLLLVVVVGISTVNTEKRLRNAFNAQQEANKASLDRSWKIIEQKSQVTAAERDSLKKAYVEIMTSQQGIAGSGQLASMFQQAQINISPGLFQDLATTIESQRESFYRDQQHLLQLKMQHDNLIATFPNSLFVGGLPQLDATIVTSAKTQAIFKDGQENDIHVFGEKAPAQP